MTEPRTERQDQGFFAQRPKQGSCKGRRQPHQQVTGYVLNASPGSRTGGDGQSGHLLPRNMGLVCLGAVHPVPLEHAAFGASIAIPLPETLEEVHSGMLRRGVLAHSDLCVA